MAPLRALLFYIISVQALSDQACESDFAELLQHQAKHTKRPGPCNTGSNRTPSQLAATFEGGGFLAHSVYSGLVSGLLAVQERNETFVDMQEGLTQLFSNVSLFASNSGGSWFFSQLAFSPSFASLIEMMAADPISASESYDRAWITPLLDILPVAMTQKTSATSRRSVVLPGAVRECKDVEFCNNDRWSIARNESLQSGHGPLGDSTILNFIELLYELVFLIKPDHDWQDFVDVLFQSTSGIDETVQMGSTVNEFVKNKAWLAAVSLATLGGEGPGTCGAALVPFKQQCLSYQEGWDSTYIFSNESKAQPSQSVSYRTDASNPKNLAGWTPAMFSIALDSGIDAGAAFPICAAGVCDSMQMGYVSSGHSVKSPLLGDQAALKNSVGKIPVRDVAGASSSFLGLLISINLWDSGTAQRIADWFASAINMIIGLPEKIKQMMKDWVDNALTTDWAYWMTQSNDAGAAFQEGRTLRKEIQKTNGTAPQALLQELAQKQFMGVVDGGNTDNSAIGQALAGGAEEVVAFSDGTDSLFQLFGGVATNQGALPLPKFLIDICPLCTIAFQVFEESATYMKSIWNQRRKCMTLNNTKLINSICVGLLDVTTTDNQWFGISAGRSVKLYVVNVDAGLGIGGYDYHEYSDVVQEIISTMLSSKNVATSEEVLHWLRALP
eukprot:TRINITY_DN109826_c0_g1_i1.p1 TRINITY_DN109826_c0_g1~~TRINITY_DN109826_c0_g1_i1.p1  ORF type:complete len:670 (-),score=109.26 TRINITY_DN109826_c0_g1_i1:325-2334(-)